MSLPPALPASRSHRRPHRHALGRRARALVPAALLGLLAPALASGPVLPASASMAPVRTAAASTATTSASSTGFFVTSPTVASRRFTSVGTVTRTPTVTFTVDRSRPAQAWWGTGAALTDASVGLLTGNDRALDLLYSPDDARGAQLDALRLPLSSTDFSPSTWTWGWDGTTATPPPPALAAVDLVTDEVVTRRPDLKVVGAAWSAPAAMKTSGTLRGGGLADAAVPAYGDLLAAQAADLRARGVPLAAVTLGNEPGHSSDYTTMTMTIQQMAALGRQVAADLPTEVALWAGDHNWEHRAAYDQLVAAAPGVFDGSAYHCYGGAPTQMNGPTPFRIVTECTGTTDGWASSFAWQLQNLVTVPVQQGSSGLLMWNLALDAANGPVDAASRGGCKSCRGLLTVDGTTLTPGPELYLLGHVARAADPGARVVPVQSTASGAIVAAFVNPDGTTGLVGVNQTSSAQTVAVKVGSTSRRFAVGAGELFTYRY